MKRQPTKQKKIFANQTSDKELISKIYIYIYIYGTQLDSNKPGLKFDKGSEKTFLRRCINGQQVYEKRLNITNHQQNAN